MSWIELVMDLTFVGKIGVLSFMGRSLPSRASLGTWNKGCYLILLGMEILFLN